MERITSRKNKYVVHLRTLGSDSAYRREQGEYLCEGEKLLEEALRFGADIRCVLWADEPTADVPASEQFSVPAELLDYVSPLKNTRGPLYSIRIPDPGSTALRNAIVLEDVQDPGNVGTVIRTASAFDIDAVLLVGDCADPYNFKTVRSTMGAIFRQHILSVDRAELLPLLRENGLKLFGAALTDSAVDIRRTELSHAAVAIGSEGHGLSPEILAMCDGQIIIPMMPHSESLNAAVAASVAMWEMNGGALPCPD